MAAAALIVAAIVLVRLAYGTPGDGVAKAGIVISNMGFIGVPLTQAVVGDEHVFYMSVIVAVQTVVIWTYCAFVITRDSSVLDARRIASNPAVVAVAAGFLLFSLSSVPSGVPGALLDGVANMNTGLAMVVLGIYLAQSELGSLIRDARIYKAAALRLVAAPALSLPILLLVPLEPAVKVVLLIGFMCPAGTTAATLCQVFGKGDYRYAAGLVAMTTLLSMTTMPLALLAGLLVF